MFRRIVVCNTAYCGRSAAAEESPADRVSIERRCSSRLHPFRDNSAALRERGYIEGQSIATEHRYAEGKIERFAEPAAEMVRLKVDIIVVAGGVRLILAAKNATKTIPIVMMGAGLDPVEAGLIESLARPGGNVTGLTLLSAELSRREAVRAAQRSGSQNCPGRVSLRSGQSGRCA